MTRTQSIIARFDAAELRLCRQLNGAACSPGIRTTLRIASRLGDGIVWYLLMGALPLLYGSQGMLPALQMALSGFAGLLLYRGLKTTFVRERPFITHRTITRVGATLDRYSFPSGHTLHAVAFSMTGTLYFPELGFVLIPLAGVIALSRVVLGLHYPTDVLAGAALGALLSATSFLVVGVLGA